MTCQYLLCGMHGCSSKDSAGNALPSQTSVLVKGHRQSTIKEDNNTECQIVVSALEKCQIMSMVSAWEKKQRRGGGQEVLERGQGHPVLNSLARKDLKDKRVYAQGFLSKRNNK